MFIINYMYQAIMYLPPPAICRTNRVYCINCGPSPKADHTLGPPEQHNLELHTPPTTQVFSLSFSPPSSLATHTTFESCEHQILQTSYYNGFSCWWWILVFPLFLPAWLGGVCPPDSDQRSWRVGLCYRYKVGEKKSVDEYNKLG
jgi:hypothetical protein